jgi:cold shock CspA family protein
MRTEGTLRNWNDERGFGFVVTAETKQDVFVHISAFPQSGRRPQPGERLSFSIETGHDGKKRAASVAYLDPPTAASFSAGAVAAPSPVPMPRPANQTRPPSQHRAAQRHRRPTGGSPWLGRALTALVACAIGATVLSTETVRTLIFPPAPAESAGVAPSAAALPATQAAAQTTALDTGAAAAAQPAASAASAASADSAGVAPIAPAAPLVVEAPVFPPAADGGFRCDGRTHCSQMTSCAEARYFLEHCPGTQMDGNGDGEPCERQWCR